MKGFIGYNTVKAAMFLPLVLLSSTGLVHAGDDFRCRLVGGDWVWFEDHAAIYVSYATKGPEGRTYEVGTGLSVNRPWGRRKEYSGEAEFIAVGIGALHIRKRDEGVDFFVCASASGLKAIPIIPRTSF